MLPGVPGLGMTTRSLSLAGRPGWKGPSMSDRSPDPTQRTGNLLLDALKQDERARVLTDARTKPIEVGRALFRPGDAIGYVPFPTSGTVSMLAQPDGSTPVEP